MDWTLAIQRNQEILLRNVAWLFSWLKLEVGASVETLPRYQRLTVLFVLRPSESACRRLVMVAMYVRGVVAPTGRARGPRPERKTSGARRMRTATPSFRLTDPRKRFDLTPNQPKVAKGPGPWVTDLWSDDPIYDRAPLYAYQERLERLKSRSNGPEDEEGAQSLCRRMNALMAALQDIDGQALRMAKLLARIERHNAQVEKPMLSPLRPGLPPGYRQRQKHEVDDVLKEMHQLTFMAQQDFKPPEP